jgi:hypothetical protein
VGARETGNAAARLVAAGRNRDAGTVAAETGPFLAGLAALTENINNALKALAGRRGGASGSGRNGLAAVPFHDLKKALLDMDTETVSRIMAACAGLPLDGDARRLIGEIREHILLFEYDRAVEKIDTTLALFGSTAS